MKRDPLFVPDHELEGSYECDGIAFAASVARWVGWIAGGVVFMAMLSFLVGSLGRHVGLF